MSFYTAINCMDGRIQESVANYIKKKYNVLFVDMITGIGPVKILSNKKTENLEPIISCIDISLKKHKSKGIAIVAHYDCTGNPIPDEEQKKLLQKAVTFLMKKYMNVSVCGLWVNKNRKVEKI
jgi:carbonic anhydrase